MLLFKWLIGWCEYLNGQYAGVPVKMFATRLFPDWPLGWDGRGKKGVSTKTGKYCRSSGSSMGEMVNNNV